MRGFTRIARVVFRFCAVFVILRADILGVCALTNLVGGKSLFSRVNFSIARGFGVLVREFPLIVRALCFMHGKISVLRVIFSVTRRSRAFVRESALVVRTHLLCVRNTRFTRPPSPSPKKKGSIPLPLSLSIHFYDSICLARKPAAVSTAFCSTSPSESSFAKMITAPIGSPFAMIGPIV